MTFLVRFFVAGDPAPKGSTKSFPYKRKDGRIGVSTTNANPRTSTWEARVASEAQLTMVGHPPVDGPIQVSIRFYMPRPKSLPKRVLLPTGRKNDLDKLLRCCLDALTGIVYFDDGQVVAIGTVTKEYATEDYPPGCFVSVGAVE